MRGFKNQIVLKMPGKDIQTLFNEQIAFVKKVSICFEKKAVYSGVKQNIWMQSPKYILITVIYERQDKKTLKINRIKVFFVC